MPSHRWMPVLLLTVLLAMPAMTAANAQTVGVATSVRPNAEGVVGGNAQTLSPGSQLYANQLVRTGNLGIADLVFIDNTNLKVGPISEVKLDKFVYDPVGSSGKVVMNMTRGAFRFVTGTQASRVYQVDTPYGTLGVRGTVVEIVVAERMARKAGVECVTKLRLVSGTGATYRTFSGKVATLTEPDQVACITPSGDVIYSTSSESILGFDVAEGEPPGVSVPPPGGTTPPPVSPTRP